MPEVTQSWQFVALSSHVWQWESQASQVWAVAFSKNSEGQFCIQEAFAEYKKASKAPEELQAWQLVAERSQSSQ